MKQGAMEKKPSKRTVWIIGASSGIGEALAKEWNKQEDLCMILSARRELKLKELNARIGGGHIVCPLDVTKPETIDAALDLIKEKGITVNHIINMSAIYTPGKFLDMPLERIEDIIDVNLTGMLRLAHKVAPFLAEQGGGQLALCGSVAGYLGLPSAQPYSATKAGVINLTESFALDLKEMNIDMRLINPGFVETDMTDQNDFKMPAIIKKKKAAKHIIKGLKGNSFEIHFPKHFTYVLKLLSILPYPIQKFLVSKAV